MVQGAHDVDAEYTALDHAVTQYTSSVNTYPLHEHSSHQPLSRPNYGAVCMSFRKYMRLHGEGSILKNNSLSANATYLQVKLALSAHAVGAVADHNSSSTSRAMTAGAILIGAATQAVSA